MLTWNPRKIGHYVVDPRLSVFHSDGCSVDTHVAGCVSALQCQSYQRIDYVPGPETRRNLWKERSVETFLLPEFCLLSRGGSLKALFVQLELPEDPPTPLLALILEQFKDQLVLILLGSAVVSFVLALIELQEPGNTSSLFAAFVEPSVIILILIANATVGVIQETSAEKAIDVSAHTQHVFLFSGCLLGEYGVY